MLGELEALMAAPFLDVVVGRPSWQADAACKEHPEVDFFPTNGHPEAAKRVCAGCIVRGECLQWALQVDDVLTGVWGGTTETERRRILRKPRVPMDYSRRPVRDDVDHGSRWGYGKGCRCERCTVANRQHRPARPGMTPRHGE